MFSTVVTTELDLTTLARDLPAGSVPAAVADQLFRSARTVRTFTAEPVTDDDLQAVWDLAQWGPTAMNTTPLRLLVVRSDEARARLAAHMNEGNRQRVLDAPLSLVLAADPSFHEFLPVLAPHMPTKRDELAAAPAAVRVGMARTNALLQAGYLIVAVRAAGLAAAPMGGMDTAGVDAEFFAQSGWQSLFVLNIGRAAGDGDAFPRAPRLGLDQVSATV